MSPLLASVLRRAAAALLPALVPALLLLGPTALPAAAAPAVAAPSVSAPEAEPASRADALVAEHLDRSPANALAWAVLRDGRAEFHGHGEDAEGRPVDGDTRFRIASMSKSFTAALVMVLAERGELDLDAPLTDAIPEFAMADPRAPAVTLRMLLAHTSGIGGGSTRDLGRPESTDPGVLLADLRDETLGSDPGTEHVYANTGYALAAAAVERVTGRPFADVLATELLDPLGMARTTVVSDCAAPVDGVGSGHTVLFGWVLPFPEPSDNCTGSGGMVSTARDVSTWLAFQAGDGTAADGRRILSAEGLRDLHSPQPGTEGVDGYGLGWSFAEDGDADLLEHGGALVTWTSHMAIVRATDGRPTGDAAVVLTDTIGAPGLLARALAADAAGVSAALPDRSPLGPGLVAGVLLVLVAVAGAVGLLRSGSWPARRRSPLARGAGLGWLGALVALCVVAPALLARVAFGTPMGLATAWHWGAGLLPEVLLLVAGTGLASVAVVAARALALARHRR